MARRSVSLITTLKQSLPKNLRLLVAVSGGKDSVALIDGLVRIKRLHNLHLEMAHVDHALRPNSAEDAKFVQSLGAKYALKVHTKVLSKPDAKINTENWGRKERYSFFKKILKDQKLDFIVTAHHAEDVAETFLMRLLSNKELRSIHSKNVKHKIIRPLLSISRVELDKYIARYSLAYKEDETNTDVKFLRNKVRIELIPKLKQTFHPRISEWILERAMALDSDSRCLDMLAKKALKGIKLDNTNLIVLKDIIAEQPLEIGLRVIEFAFLKQLGFRLGRSRSKNVRKLILGQIRRCSLPAGLILERKGPIIVLTGLA